MKVLSNIILRLDRKPFQAHIPVEVDEMFDRLGRHMPFVYRIVFANLWCFRPLLKKILPLLGRELNALCRTTCVFTMAEGSSAANVIPERVRAVANLRLAAINSIEQALNYITEQAMAASEKARRGEEPLRLAVKLIQGHNASPSSSTSSQVFKLVEKTIEDVFDSPLVTPYIMLGASDSRHYCAISENVLRFSPIEMSKEELRSIHGIDERIAVEKMKKVVEFYLELLNRYK